MASTTSSFDSPTHGREIPEIKHCSISEHKAIAELCQRSQVGKLLPNSLYVHVWALPALDTLLQHYESLARLAVPQLDKYTIVKFNTVKPKISYLFYPNFDTDPHPSLQASIQVDLQSLQSSYRDYSQSVNPPVLHRKEAFVTTDYPLYEQFAQLTRQEEALGLLNNSKAIGTRQRWLRRLEEYGVEIQGHTLVCRYEKSPTRGVSELLLPQIERHKAAIVRNNFSRPVRLALEAGLFSPATAFLTMVAGTGVMLAVLHSKVTSAPDGTLTTCQIVPAHLLILSTLVT